MTPCDFGGHLPPEGMDKRTGTAYARGTAVECPDADTLGSLLSDALPPAARAAVANHAASCSSCHAVIEALVGSGAIDATAVGRPGETGAVATVPGGGAPAGFQVGDRLDRYVIESKLGAGGMGVVYTARDPDLGRRVALKLLRAGAPDDRLLREAQSLARLSHPNVVAVHDVGRHDGQTFIAMALVDGSNLRKWLVVERPVREILRQLVAAGRGLAAAHAAGLIHRDLKPDNIFVAEGGQALVGDFGLARDRDDVPMPVSVSSGLISPELTMSGTVLGTPAYMAPEQAVGEATAASDQFSFCVTAWEALYRARPFGGDSLEALLANVSAGRILTPKRDPGVPAAVRRALIRGMSADPAARFPSMDALLDAMNPPPRRWPWAVAGVVILGGGGLAFGLTRSPSPAVAPPPDAIPCELEVMIPTQRDGVLQALTARAPADAADTTRMLATLDRYAGEWNAMRATACAAASAPQLDCLDQRAATLHAVMAQMMTTTGMSPRDAWRVAEELRPVDHCARAAISPASDELELALADARRGLDRFELETAEASARRALAIAEKAHDDLHQALAGALLSETLVRLDRYDEAAGQLVQAQTAQVRAGSDWEVTLALAHARAVAAAVSEDRTTQIAALTSILDEQRRRRGDDSLQVTNAALELFAALQDAGRDAEASEVYALIADPGADLEARIVAAGRATHESEVAAEAGELQRSLELARLALAIYLEMPSELTIPPDDIPSLARSVAFSCELAGDWACARDAYRRSATTAHDIGLRVDSEEGAAAAYNQLGRPADAIDWGRKALAGARAIDDADRIEMATNVLARALVDTGQMQEAIPLLEAALRHRATDPEPRPQRRAAEAILLARALWDTGGDRARARQLADEAVRDFIVAYDRFGSVPAYINTRRQFAKRRDAAVAWRDAHQE